MVGRRRHFEKKPDSVLKIILQKFFSLMVKGLRSKTYIYILAQVSYGIRTLSLCILISALALIQHEYAFTYLCLNLVTCSLFNVFPSVQLMYPTYTIDKTELYYLVFFSVTGTIQMAVCFTYFHVHQNVRFLENQEAARKKVCHHLCPLVDFHMQ